MAALRGGPIVSFSIGAALMVPLMAIIGYLAFVVPGLFILIAAARSFIAVRGTQIV